MSTRGGRVITQDKPDLPVRRRAISRNPTDSPREHIVTPLVEQGPRNGDHALPTEAETLRQWLTIVKQINVQTQHCIDVMGMNSINPNGIIISAHLCERLLACISIERAYPEAEIGPTTGTSGHIGHGVRNTCEHIETG